MKISEKVPRKFREYSDPYSLHNDADDLVLVINACQCISTLSPKIENNGQLSASLEAALPGILAILAKAG